MFSVPQTAKSHQPELWSVHRHRPPSQAMPGGHSLQKTEQIWSMQPSHACLSIPPTSATPLVES